MLKVCFIYFNSQHSMDSVLGRIQYKAEAVVKAS